MVEEPGHVGVFRGIIYGLLNVYKWRFQLSGYLKLFQILRVEKWYHICLDNKFMKFVEITVQAVLLQCPIQNSLVAESLLWLTHKGSGIYIILFKKKDPQ